MTKYKYSTRDNLSYQSEYGSRKLKLKVCGMKNPKNINELIEIKPDYMGFIFYSKSPRYVGDIDEDMIMRIPMSIRKVGVFVNESIDLIVKHATNYGLQYIQLHGDEDLHFVRRLKEKGLKVIKVFRLLDAIPYMASQYQDSVDYFLFDTSTPGYGGSGRHFDWNILNTYSLKTPFFLSGGIGLDDIEHIQAMDIEQLIAIDVNSRFEIALGEKDLNMLKKLKAQL